MSADLRDLRAILARDPDGHTTEPTEADHAAFGRWAVATYGPATWARYLNGAWFPTPDA